MAIFTITIAYFMLFLIAWGIAKLLIFIDEEWVAYTFFIILGWIGFVFMIFPSLIKDEEKD